MENAGKIPIYVVTILFIQLILNYRRHNNLIFEPRVFDIGHDTPVVSPHPEGVDEDKEYENNRQD